MIVREFPVLFKRTASGSVQTWRVWVESEDEVGVVCLEYGLQGGKLQSSREYVREGKNLNKSNQTDGISQAISEAASRHTKQIKRKHYGLDVEAEESAAKKAVAPQLAHSLDKMKKPINWSCAYGQPKLDGHRCLAFKKDGVISLVSREGKDITTVPHINLLLDPLMEDGEIWDGELYVHGVPLKDLSSWIKKAGPNSGRLQYHVYDAISDMRFYDRYHNLKVLVDDPDGFVRTVLTQKLTSREELDDFEQICIDAGYEGCMLRHGTTPYEAGKRSYSLLKVKKFLDGEFKIVGVQEGKGSHEGMAIFTCVTGEGNEFDVTAPGTHEEKQDAWKNRDQLIGKLLTVKYAYFTKTDKPVPFHPTAKCIKETL